MLLQLTDYLLVYLDRHFLTTARFRPALLFAQIRRGATDRAGVEANEIANAAVNA
jgi:hypothetical protein